MTCQLCQKPIEHWNPWFTLGGLLTATMCPVGPARRIAEFFTHREATQEHFCTPCCGRIFQPAWLPLSPADQTYLDKARR